MIVLRDKSSNNNKASKDHIKNKYNSSKFCNVSINKNNSSNSSSGRSSSNDYNNYKNMSNNGNSNSSNNNEPNRSLEELQQEKQKIQQQRLLKQRLQKDKEKQPEQKLKQELLQPQIQQRNGPVFSFHQDSPELQLIKVEQRNIYVNGRRLAELSPHFARVCSSEKPKDGIGQRPLSMDEMYNDVLEMLRCILPCELNAFQLQPVTGE
uniref:BTB domain-containing protein n=1 Tax=Plectus sambesii TaxID=2011161 RepID=A0A914W4J1_9BILA